MNFLASDVNYKYIIEYMEYIFCSTFLTYMEAETCVK